jgi:DUF1365 family protein
MSGDSKPQPSQQSCLYYGTAAHRRHDEHKRSFVPKLYIPFLDLDSAASDLKRVRPWSWTRIVRYRAEDYFDGKGGDLAAAVRTYTSNRLGRPLAGKVFMLAHVRTFGWLFNPFVAYYFYDHAGDQLDAILIEVTNTPWHEREWYVIDAKEYAGEEYEKGMYVSPFMPMGLQYTFEWLEPGPTLKFVVDVKRDGEPMLTATLMLRRTALTARTGAWALVKYPFMTHRVTGGIYAQAAKLIAGRVRLYRH